MFKNQITLIFSQNATFLAFVGAVVFLILLVILHGIEREFNPSWRMISEYELGKYGWIMQLAFCSLSLSSLFTIVSIHSFVHTIGGSVGIILLAVICIALVGAAIFTTDPITAPKDALTSSGILHNLCALIVIPGFPIAITLIDRSLANNQILTLIQHWLPWMTALVWIGFLAFIVSMIVFMKGKNRLGPDVLIGWPNRFMMLTYTMWFLIIAWRLKMIN